MARQDTMRPDETNDPHPTETVTSTSGTTKATEETPTTPPTADTTGGDG